MKSETELVVREELVPRMATLSPEYAEIMSLGRVFKMSGYFQDIRDEAQAVTKILFGRELGLSPIVSMVGIHIIEGKPSVSANTLAALIKRSGRYDYRVTAWDSTQCVLMFRQKTDGKWEEVGESSFTMDDAKRAGVSTKGVWTKYPKAMLFARAISQGERTYCPDVSACALYVPEELGAEVNESGEVTQLPASARPTTRTTADIEIGGGPAQSSGVTDGSLVKDADVKDAPKPAPVSLPKARKPKADPVASVTADVKAALIESNNAAEPQRNENIHDDTRHYDEPLPADLPPLPADEFCTLEQQTWLRKEFMAKLPHKYAVASISEQKRKQWLYDNGFLKPDGKASSTVIRADEFRDVAKRMLEFARTAV